MIVVYSKNDCPGCTALKQRLKAKGVEFNEVNIDTSVLAKEFLIKEGYRSVPQIFKNGINIKEQDIA